MEKNLQYYIDQLKALNFKEMYENDFFLTWDKTDDELKAIWVLADALRYMREHNISTKVFESGLGISISATTRLVPASPLLRLVTSLVWKYRISMKEEPDCSWRNGSRNG